MDVLVHKLGIKKIAESYGFSFVRVFGSSLKSYEKARDIDLVVPPVHVNSPALLDLVSELESLFQKKLDLIFLSEKISPALILEIARESVPYTSPRLAGKTTPAGSTNFMPL
ncbi:MAG: nucleotidyltransferase family protein, partial [Bdellovibrionales bacterium]